jgi:hypothetical protein
MYFDDVDIMCYLFIQINGNIVYDFTGQHLNVMPKSTDFALYSHPFGSILSYAQLIISYTILVYNKETLTPYLQLAKRESRLFINHLSNAITEIAFITYI